MLHPHPALQHLKDADPVMARVIELAGPCTLRPRRSGTHFNHIARSIIYQQLSGKAAATIYDRVRATLGRPYLDPAALLAASDQTLRTAGLSRQKIAYLKSFAEHAASGRIPFARLGRMPDEEIIERLVEVKGIGRWTVQMLLIFRLGRPDVLPVNDLGVQKGMQIAYGLRSLPNPKRVAKIGAAWAPYRSVGAWYCWRMVEVDAARRAGQAS